MRRSRLPLAADAALKFVTRKLTIPVLAPFRLDFTVWALMRRPANHVDQWDNGGYSRVFVIDDVPVRVVVRQATRQKGTSAQPALEVTFISRKQSGTAQERQMLSVVRRMPDTDVLLRGLGRLDILPGDDVGAQNNLRRLFDLPAKPDYFTIDRLTSRWQPYRGMIYFHLLLQKLRQTGLL